MDTHETAPEAPQKPRQLARPGWFTDPADMDRLRYWNGRQWTARTRPGYPAAVITRVPRHNWHALATIATGGLWLPVWLSRGRTKVLRR